MRLPPRLRRCAAFGTAVRRSFASKGSRFPIPLRLLSAISTCKGKGFEPAEARAPFRSQHQGDKWIAAVYAVSAFDILKSGSFEVNVTDMSPRATSNEAAPTAHETIASIIPFRPPQKAKTDAARARAYRQRKRQKAKASPNHESPSSESLIPEGFSSADSTLVEPPAPAPTVTLRDVTRDRSAPSRSISTISILLRAAAVTLAAVGIAMNGWFARSLGSSDAA